MDRQIEQLLSINIRIGCFGDSGSGQAEDLEDAREAVPETMMTLLSRVITCTLHEIENAAVGARSIVSEKEEDDSATAW